MVHAECPLCGVVGYVINGDEGSAELEIEHDRETVTVCYGDFGVVLH